ncbi:hypothetical protein QYF36_013608 [Acer negundo]|nr:hypothetical protein QYF36_013608 [Acer negundo]
MFVEPEITPTNQKVARWYYEGLQNMDDLYRAPGALDNMPNEYEDGHSTGNLTPPRSRLPSAAGPSGIATPTPTPTKGVADILPLQVNVSEQERYRGTRPCSTTISTSRYCPRACLVLSSFGSSSDGPTKSRGPGSFSDGLTKSRGPGFSSGAITKSRAPLSSIDGPAFQEHLLMAQQTFKVQEPLLMAQLTSKVQDPLVMGSTSMNYRPVRLRKQLLISVNAGGDHWLIAKMELTLRSIRLYDPWGQEVKYQVRNQQVAYLQWFLPSMLNQIGFYKKR